MSDVQRRLLRDSLQYRAASDSTRLGALDGHAAKFEKKSRNLGGFVEIVDKRAFNKTVGEADVRCLLNHEASALLGRRSGRPTDTLVLDVDGIGLRYVVAELPDTTAGRDVDVLGRRGDMRESSFAFRTVNPGQGGDEWTLDDGVPLCRLLEVQLYDVSPVTFPAYPDATSQVRGAYASLAKAMDAPVEDVLAHRSDLTVFFRRTDGQQKPPAAPAHRDATPQLTQLLQQALGLLSVAPTSPAGEQAEDELTGDQPDGDGPDPSDDNPDPTLVKAPPTSTPTRAALEAQLRLHELETQERELTRLTPAR